MTQKPRRYAEGTQTKVETSVAELRRAIVRYGGSNLAMMEDDDTPAIAALFQIGGRWVRFLQKLPRRPDGTRSTSRNPRAMFAQHDAEVRRRWRVLLLRVKSRLEEFAEGESTWEECFLPYAVLADNRTVAEALAPELERMYRTGSMPRMLEAPAPKGGQP
jgi:hypothetical protein